MDDVGGQCSTHKGMGFAGIMQKAQLQGYQTLRAKLYLLDGLALFPVPNGQRIAIVLSYFCRIEALQASAQLLPKALHKRVVQCCAKYNLPFRRRPGVGYSSTLRHYTYCLF